MVKIRVDELPKDLLLPDLVFYLVAPHQPLVRGDVAYMADLLRHMGDEKLVFVFNLFCDKQTGRPLHSSPENVEDAAARIGQAYAKAGLGGGAARRRHREDFEREIDPRKQPARR